MWISLHCYTFHFYQMQLQELAPYIQFMLFPHTLCMILLTMLQNALYKSFNARNTPMIKYQGSLLRNLPHSLQHSGWNIFCITFCMPYPTTVTHHLSTQDAENQGRHSFKQINIWKRGWRFGFIILISCLCLYV